MKGFISMGTLLFITLLIALTALVFSVFAAVMVGNTKPVVNYLVKPAAKAPTAPPEVTASPSATVSPKRVFVPTKTVSPVASVSPTEK